jgi:hypothetical protein
MDYLGKPIDRLVETTIEAMNEEQNLALFRLFKRCGKRRRRIAHRDNLPKPSQNSDEDRLAGSAADIHLHDNA